MKKRISVIVLTVALIAAVSFVQAQDHPVYFKAPISFAGTGCPVGSISVTGEGNPTLTIMFDRYDAAEPAENAASTLSRSSCNFAVPVHVPAGWQISVLTADWIGFSQGETVFNRQYFFADQTNGMKLVTQFNDPYLNGIDYTERDSLEPGNYTACQPEDRDVILRINSDIQAKSDKSYIAIDTIDMDNKVVFKLNSRTCRRDGLPFIPLLLLQGFK